MEFLQECGVRYLQELNLEIPSKTFSQISHESTNFFRDASTDSFINFPRISQMLSQMKKINQYFLQICLQEFLWVCREGFLLVLNQEFELESG